MCYIKFLFKQEFDFVKEIIIYFGLLDAAVQFFIIVNKGQVILVNLFEKVVIQVMLFDFEWDYVIIIKF